MKTTRQDLVDALAVHDPAQLRAILDAVGLGPLEAESPRATAERIAAALWWEYATPLGYVAGHSTFDDIVDHVARKLQVAGAIGETDAWTRLRRMTRLVVARNGPVSLEDLSPTHRARLSPSWKRTAAFASGASGSFGSWAAGRAILHFSRTNVGRLLPLVPKVGPVVRGIYSGGGAAALFGGPAGIALAVLAANNALGANYHRLVPLLLGVGALGPSAVHDAVELDR